MTTRKQLYKIMSTFSDDATYQEALWDAYKRSIKNDIYNVHATFLLILLIIWMCLQLLRGMYFISVRTMFITIGIILLLSIPSLIQCGILLLGTKLSTGNSDLTINADILNYLNDIAQKNCKVIENNNAHVTKENDDTLRIVIDGEILKQRFTLQKSIDKCRVQTRKYFIINEIGHIDECCNYTLICDGQIVQENIVL